MRGFCGNWRDGACSSWESTAVQKVKECCPIRPNSVSGEQLVFLWSLFCERLMVDTYAYILDMVYNTLNTQYLKDGNMPAWSASMKSQR